MRNTILRWRAEGRKKTSAVWGLVRKCIHCSGFLSSSQSSKSKPLTHLFLMGLAGIHSKWRQGGGSENDFSSIHSMGVHSAHCSNSKQLKFSCSSTVLGQSIFQWKESRENGMFWKWNAVWKCTKSNSIQNITSSSHTSYFLIEQSRPLHAPLS